MFSILFAIRRAEFHPYNTAIEKMSLFGSYFFSGDAHRQQGALAEEWIASAVEMNNNADQPKIFYNVQVI